MSCDLGRRNVGKSSPWRWRCAGAAGGSLRPAEGPWAPPPLYAPLAVQAVDFQLGGVEDRLAGWRSGSGIPVLVLHGGPGLSDYTESLVAELGPSYETIRYQQRGLEPSTTSGPFDVETQVDDVLRVMDHLQLDRPLVLGHSWGGHLAMHLIATHPERVQGTLIVDPLGAVPDGGEEDLGRNLAERASPEAAARSAELDARALQGEGTEEDAIEGLRLVWPGYFADPKTAPPMPPMRMSVAAYSETFTSIRQHFGNQTLVRLLPTVRVATAFLLGQESPIPNSHGMASAALIEGARVDVLAHCGHLPWLEQPGSVRAALDRLVGRAVPSA